MRLGKKSNENKKEVDGLTRLVCTSRNLTTPLDGRRFVTLKLIQKSHFFCFLSSLRGRLWVQEHKIRANLLAMARQNDLVQHRRSKQCLTRLYLSFRGLLFAFFFSICYSNNVRSINVLFLLLIFFFFSFFFFLSIYRVFLHYNLLFYVFINHEKNKQTNKQSLRWIGVANSFCIWKCFIKSDENLFLKKKNENM